MWCVGRVGASRRPGESSSRGWRSPSGPWWRTVPSIWRRWPTRPPRSRPSTRLLRGVPGIRTLLEDRAAAVAIEDRARRITERLTAIETELDERSAPSELEVLNAALVRLKDAVWAVWRDRLRNARAVGDLAGAGASIAALEAFTSVQVALSAIDRLEVRGRDSAGLSIVVRNHGLADADPGVVRLLEARQADPLFVHGAVRRSGDVRGVRLQGGGRDR